MSYLKTQQSAPQGSGPVANYGGLLTQLMQAMRDARPPNKRGPREGNWAPPEPEGRARKPAVAADGKNHPEAPGSTGRFNSGAGSSQQQALRNVRGKRNRVVTASDDDRVSEAERGGQYDRRGGGIGS